jgi:hypothetical protein
VRDATAGLYHLIPPTPAPEGNVLRRLERQHIDPLPITLPSTVHSRRSALITPYYGLLPRRWLTWHITPFPRSARPPHSYIHPAVAVRAQRPLPGALEGLRKSLTNLAISALPWPLPWFSRHSRRRPNSYSRQFGREGATACQLGRTGGRRHPPSGPEDHRKCSSPLPRVQRSGILYACVVMYSTYLLKRAYTWGTPAYKTEEIQVMPEMIAGPLKVGI